MEYGRIFNSFVMLLYVFLAIAFSGIGILDGPDYRGLNTAFLLLIVLRFLWTVIANKRIDFGFLYFYLILICSSPFWMTVLLQRFWQIKCFLGIYWAIRLPSL